MSIFKRLFKIGQSEAHSIVDKLENPIKLTEQGIRDLKKDLDESLRSFAEVKAIAIRSRKESSDALNKANSYEQKAIRLLQKAKEGELTTDEADRLAGEALMKKQDADRQSNVAKANAVKVEANLVQLDANIKKLRATISQYENELKTLKARSKVSQATIKLNKQMAEIDGEGTIAMLEKMKMKVTENEALSEAYAEIVENNKSVDEEIDEVLASDKQIAAKEALEKLKEKMKENPAKE